MTINVVGAGLAGCEAAYRLALAGHSVKLYEMKPKKHSPAHKSDMFAELVCSNSLKAMREGSAAGLLKAEMRRLGSLCLEAADASAVPAGGALAVDRDKFSEYITAKIKAQDNIETICREVDEIPQGYTIIASGPLTSDVLSKAISKLLEQESISFYDAAAPIVTAASVDMSVAFAAARYGRGSDDYINCPMDREEYMSFYNALISAESAELKDFDKKSFTVYEGCMPIEVMAKRGSDTIRYGPLKPVGLTNPHTGQRPFAVVQLRKENAEGSMLNIVGFQTNLKFGEQKRVFSMIPGLNNAEFVRYGVMHRNTFINSPKLLNSDFSLNKDSNIYFAGQITGVEGYMESAASGIIAAESLVRSLSGKAQLVFPRETMLGGLTGYISDKTVVNFQPMGANMGLLPPLENRIKSKQERYEQIAKRALEKLDKVLSEGKEE